MRVLLMLASHLNPAQTFDIQSALKNRIAELGGAEVTLFVDSYVDGNDPGPHDAEEAVHRAGLRQAIGPGGYRKIAFRYALDRAYDVVITFDAEGAYAADALSSILAPFQDSTIDCVLGDFQGPVSLFRRAWRLISNRLHNSLAQSAMRSWHAGCRAYRTQALSKIAFELNTNESHFDTEVLLQLRDQKVSIIEVPLPIDAPRARNFPSIERTVQSLKATLRYRLQQVNLFYDFRFHPDMVFGQTAAKETAEYNEKFSSVSPHTFVCSDPTLITPGSRVLDIGCSSGYVAQRLVREKNCRVTGIDIIPASAVKNKDFPYHQIDLEKELDKLDAVLAEGRFDFILMLDVLEHLSTPELFLLRLYKRKYPKPPVFIFSTGNVAFIVIRLMLMTGYFNYGNKGILDITHKRLFSTRTFKNLLDQTGFISRRRVGFPLPFRELGWPPRVCRWLEQLNVFFIRLRFTLFAYQVMVVATPLSSPEQTLASYLYLPQKEDSVPNVTA